MVGTSVLKAAQYLRVSTERQDLSLEFQRATNTAYALEHGYEIVRTYADEGLSGINLKNRPGLKALLGDILGGVADFTLVLVYDVSRWGRFQNPDQSAHYEFMCVEAGVQVAYCAEPFDNDGSPTATLIKQIKRAMAAEYSRDLSQKVSLARRTIRAQGFWVGGNPPYGYRRQVVDRSGQPSDSPDLSVWQKRQGVHTRLILGPANEVAIVRRIFQMYSRPKMKVASIVRWLNTNNIPNNTGRAWVSARVCHLLQNETYVGNLVAKHRIAEVGGDRKVLLPEQEWIVAEDAVPAIVSKRIFRKAQRKHWLNAQSISDEAVLEDARRVAQEQGTLSSSLLNRFGRWGSLLYQRRFGGMQRLRALVGVRSAPQYRRLNDRLERSGSERWRGGKLYSDDEIVEAVKGLLRENGVLSSDLLDQVLTVPCSQTCRRRFGNLGNLYRRVGYEPLPHQLAAGRRVWTHLDTN